jgi:hypothetical protein
MGDLMSCQLNWSAIASSRLLDLSVEKTSSRNDCDLGGRVHPQLAWAKLRAHARRRGDREQEVVELNFKSACAGGTKQKQESLEVKVSPLLSFLFGSLRMFTSTWYTSERCSSEKVHSP